MSSETPVVLIFGGTGLTGKPLVQKALEKELRVRLYVRDESKVEEEVKSNEKVEIVKGDLTDLESVKKACEGATYIVSTAGSNEQSKQRFMSKMVEAIIEVMPEYNVKRIFYQAGAFTPKPGEKLPFMAKVMRVTLGPMFGIKDMLLDNDAVVQMLAQSEVKWVVGMPGMIKDGASKGTLKAGNKAGQAVVATDLAAFDLECVLSEEFEGKAVWPNY